MRLHERRDAKCLDRCRLVAGARSVLDAIIITLCDLGLRGATDNRGESERDVVEVGRKWTLEEHRLSSDTTSVTLNFPLLKECN